MYVYRYNKEIDYISYYKNKYSKNLDTIYITATDFNVYENDILKYKDKCKVYFVIPSVTLKNTTNYVLTNLEALCKKGITGILIGNIGFIPLCSKLKNKYDIEMVADYSLNIMNKYTAILLENMGMDRVTPLFENDDVQIDIIDKIIPVELVQDMATVMTTRYCVIASFVKDASQKGICGIECKKNRYYLVDEYNKRYDIVSDNIDCITKYVRNKRQYTYEQEEKYSIRHCIL